MAQFRTTADLVDSVLRRSGELTDGTSRFESQALDYLNKLHHKVITGGSAFNLTINESWIWAKNPWPIILELQPKYNTGTVTLTLGSEAGTFSAAPAVSLEGWYFKIADNDEYFKIAQHTAASTAFELDAAYTITGGAGLSFEAYKLEYKIVPDFLVIDSSNNKIDFVEAGTTEITATLAAGVYSPADLATQVATQLNVTGGTPAYTCTYSALTRKFTLGSDRASSAVFLLYGAGTNAQFSALKTLGFDYANQTNAASHTSTYPLGMVSSLLSPMTVYRKQESGQITGITESELLQDYPLNQLAQGIPTRFSLIREERDGLLTVRFNKYPDVKTRIEIPHIPVPFDLKDNTASVALIPRKFADVLEYGAAHFVLMDKNDTKAKGYFDLTGAELQAMVNQNRMELTKIGPQFGELTPRREQTNLPRKLNYGYTS